METQTEVTPPIDTHQQMISNAEAQIAALENERRAILARLDAIVLEHTSISAQAQARQFQIEQATQNAAQAQADLDAQMAAAKIAQGTTASARAAEPLDACHERAERLRNEKNRLISQAQAQDDQEQARRGDLAQEEIEARIRLVDLENELAGMAKAKAAALRDWGEQEHREAVIHLEWANQTIADMEKQLANARMARQAIFERDQERLAAWPDHRANLRKIVPLNDPVTATLEAGLAWIDALLTHGNALPTDIQSSAVSQRYMVLDALLFIPESEYEDIRGKAQWLRERRESMAAVLAGYRQRLAEYRQG